MDFKQEVIDLAERRRAELLDQIDTIHRELEDIQAFVELLDYKRPSKNPAPYGDNSRKVLAALESDRPKTVRELTEETGITRQTVDNVIRKLAKAGRVEDVRPNPTRGSKSNPAMWIKVAVVQEVKEKKITWP